MDAFDVADVAVSFETGGDASLEATRADLAGYLTTMWGAPVTVDGVAPAYTHKVTVWLSTSADAGARASLAADKTYALSRVDDAKGTTVVVAAHDATGLTYGAYALLETMGVRFFHPKQEYVPHFPSARIPKALAVARSPSVPSRGLQFHTLHPIEYFKVFLEPSADNLADAKRVVDWLVKTGQNELQFPLLSTVDWASWAPHAQALLDYAHLRHVSVGAAVQTWGGSSLQNNFVLVRDASQWQPQMDQALDQLMTLNWDVVELALGEFSGADPQTVIDWLNHAVAHLLATHPALEVNVQNHVGNYKNLYVQYQGQTVFFYHLPQFTDTRLGQSVHTLYFFDLYRDWATYAHPDFHLQHDYILKELPTRRVKYFPESAYWISADVDVPLFLPEFVYSRYNDIHTLTAEIAQDKLPPLGGHVTFTSGHEWGYWLTDYLTAKMLWQPEAPLDTFTSDYAAAFGSCANDAQSYLTSLVQIQSHYLFDQRLVPYLQGENAIVDLGYLAGLETHPKRVEFEEVLAMAEPDRANFEASVVVGLESMVAEMKPIEADVSARCRGSDADIAPWCDELWDGVAIVRNRAEHTAHLYRSILALARGTNPEGELSAAKLLTGEAATIVARREKQYRFDASRMVDAYANPTVYAYGYLRPAHTQCYWLRREEQVRYLIDNGVPEGTLSLPTCQN